MLSKLKTGDSGQVFVADKHGGIVSALIATGVVLQNKQNGENKHKIKERLLLMAMRVRC